MFRFKKELDENQEAAVERAAYVLIRAQEDAAEILRQHGIALPDNPDNPFASPCQGSFNPHDGFTSPPSGPVACACPRYRGDGGPCINTFISVDGPGGAGGPPRRKCGHPPSAHFRMD